jgi:hypothetical protein
MMSDQIDRERIADCPVGGHRVARTGIGSPATLGCDEVAEDVPDVASMKGRPLKAATALPHVPDPPHSIRPR